jgi:hypothetical protein
VLGRNKQKYLSVFYDENSNYIHVEAINNQSAKSLLAATKSAIKFFTARESPIIEFRLDNQISDQVRNYLSKEKITIDLTPVGQHRRNKAERAIRTYKNHFTSSLAGVDKECPLELWPDFLEQIELTINLFRTASVGISAWSALHGPVDFNKTPIAPLGVKVVAHVPADSRASWAQHGDIGFYVGRALDHYRCYKVWIQKTKDFCISDCLAWFPIFKDAIQPTAQYPLVPPGFVPLPALPPPTQGGKQRVVVTTTTPSGHIPVQQPEQLIHQKKNRSEARYTDLTAVELARLPKSMLSKIDKQFTDITDAPAIYEGVIVAIVRQTKSKSLCFKYYDPNLYSSPPRDE